jgi:hypothetical protein
MASTINHSNGQRSKEVAAGEDDDERQQQQQQPVRGEEGEEETCPPTSPRPRKPNHHHHHHQHSTIDFLQDPPQEMTNGRRIALWLAQKFPRIYYPASTQQKKNKETNGAETEPPSLEKAWAFFEHVTLQRYLILSDQDEEKKEQRKLENGEKEMEEEEEFFDCHSSACPSSDGLAEEEDADDGGYRYYFQKLRPTTNITQSTTHLVLLEQRRNQKMTAAQPGESHFPTKLYPLLSTPLSQLGDFGLGFGIYFATIKAYAILVLLGGILSIPNIYYFASSDYNHGPQEGVPTLLKGSAICTNRSWVPCPTCEQEQFEESTAGAYQVHRFFDDWIFAPATEGWGFFWNVTDYLEWGDASDQEIYDASLDALVATYFPTDDELNMTIVLNAVDGYILDGVNVTEELGYTPLHCWYGSECYLDVYPLIQTADDYFDFVENGGEFNRGGDVDMVYLAAALRNNCDGATLHQGFVNYGTVLIMILGTFVVILYVNKMEVQFDEDEQTAQDYSIVVENPPEDAHDPEEWKQFFEQAFSSNDGDDTSNRDESFHVTGRSTILHGSLNLG